jgi:glycosyltransferase involved in cell wall biosynthesis
VTASPSDAPTISVVIPARDRAETLARSLESVARQTVPVLEVVVVDDGSEDDTAAVARRHGATVLTHDVARGSGEARNTGIRAAAGTWVAFLDSDDEWLPSHVETFLAQVGDNILVSTRAVDSLGANRGYLGSRVATLDPPRCFVPEMPVVTSGCFVRRDKLLAAGLFRDFPRAQDLDMWARVLEHGPGVALPDTTVRYLITDSGLSEASRQRNIFYLRQVAGALRDRPWAGRGFYRAIEARIHWDACRRGMSGRDLAMTRSHVGWLVTHPLAWWDVARLVLSRRGVEVPRRLRPHA